MKNVIFVDFKSKKKLNRVGHVIHRIFGNVFSKIGKFANWLDEKVLFDSKMIQVVEKRNSIILTGSNGQIIKFNKKTVSEIKALSLSFTYPGTTEQVKTVTRYKTDKVVQVDFKKRTYKKEAYEVEVKTKVRIEQQFLIESKMGMTISSFSDREVGACVSISNHFGLDRILITKEVFLTIMQVLAPTSQFKRPALVHSIDEKQIS